MHAGGGTQPQIIAALAKEAAVRIAGHVRETPLDYSRHFSRVTGAEVYCKLENLQYTGSFKLRGAFNHLLSLDDSARQAGCVAASSGNHGAAVACAMTSLGINGVIFVPEQASPAKVQAISEFGADVRTFGTDGLDTEVHARQFAQDRGMTYVSPYNDIAVIAGQGTCGVEIARQLPDADAIFIAVGGGGLLSGVGSVLRTHNPDLKVIACQPENSAVMARSVEAGHIVSVTSEATLSDGTAGGIEQDSITFPLVNSVANRFTLVSESEIASAMRAYVDAEHQLIEGAAGVALASLLKDPRKFEGSKVVILVCGANISRPTLTAVLGD